MLLDQLKANPLWMNCSIFACISIIIVLAGILLQRSADSIALRTGLQRAFVGVLILSAATSLPETASTIGAARTGNADLAVSALMGATLTQISLLIIADISSCRRGALTHLTPQFLLLFQGVGLVMLLAAAIVGMTAGPIATLGRVDAWALLILACYVAVIYFTYRIQAFPRWQPTGAEREASHIEDLEAVCPAELAEIAQEEQLCRGWKSGAVVGLFVGSAVVIFAAGWSTAVVAEVLAVQTGLGASFVGVTVLAFTTSTPELFSVISSSRQGAYSLAFSNVIGSTMYNIFLLVIAEIAYTGGSIFHDVNPSAVFAAAVSAIITCVYLWGLLEHENRTVLRLGWDSAVVLFLFLGGYYVLYLLM